jgi:hypothetical protein
MATMTWTSVKGANIITRVGELPTTPITSYFNSWSLMRMATAKAEVVKVMFINLKSRGTYIFDKMKALKRFFLDGLAEDISVPDSSSRLSCI